MRLLAFRAVFAVLLALLAPAAANARGTLDNILPQIRAQHPGRLSDAEAWTDDAGGTHYRIKWMTPEGRILFFDADARTGRYGTAGNDAWHGNGGGRGEYDNGGQGEHRSHFAGEDGNDDSGSDWRNRNGGRDNNNGAWSRGGGGDWRDRGQAGGGELRDRGQSGGGQGGGDWRNNNRGGNWGGRGAWGGGGHGGGNTHRHGNGN